MHPPLALGDKATGRLDVVAHKRFHGGAVLASQRIDQLLVSLQIFLTELLAIGLDDVAILCEIGEQIVNTKENVSRASSRGVTTFRMSEERHDFDRHFL